jgi:hypothetical protein
MVKNKFTKLLLILIVEIILGGYLISSSDATTATLTINAGVTVNTFQPINIFGSNVAYWISKTDNDDAQTLVQNAGNFFLRYPGGSSSDDYHWNGTGTWTSPPYGTSGYGGASYGYWVPSSTQYSPGFQANELYRGTTSSYGTASNITDGNVNTYWVSNSDTNFPDAQWIYVNLGSQRTVNAVTIIWGNPYASQFTIQYWDPTASNQWGPYLDTQSHWLNTSAVSVVGGGGTQGVTFSNVTTQYIRVLLTQSSAGANGVYSIAEFYAYDGATVLTTNTSNAGTQSQVVTSSTDTACDFSYTPSFDFQSFMSYVKMFSPQAIPLITVNFGEGSPQEAAAWVNYANNVEGYNIKYWQIGNEMDGTWETGGPINAEDYVTRYMQFAQAMYAVDPNIIITGPVASSWNASSNMYDGNSMIQDFVDYLVNDGGTTDVGAIDFHWYPFYSSASSATVLASPQQWAQVSSYINNWISALPQASTIPIILSEYNSNSSAGPTMTVELTNGLWLVDWLGQFITYFGSRGFTNLWDVLNGGAVSQVSGDLGYLQVESNAYQFQPRADYWAMQMMTNDWASPGDNKAHALVATAVTVAGNPSTLLDAYTDYRPDGILSLIVDNKDANNTYSTSVSIEGFTSSSNVKTWTFDSNNYAWETSSLPYHATPDLPPTQSTIVISGNTFSYTFPTSSITDFQFTSALPTATPTATLTTTPTSTTPTPTLTPIASADFTPTPVIFSQVPTIYPNPNTGGPLQISYSLAGNVQQVEVQIFTLAYRKIFQDGTLMTTAGNHIYSVDLAQNGIDLANGLYYVLFTIHAPSGMKRKILKWIILK